MRIFAILFCLFFLNSNSIAQELEEYELPPQGKDEYRHRCNLHKNEIGIANAPVYFINEKELTYGFHFHYVRNIGKSPFGIGVGYERIFDEHQHQTIGVVGSYRFYGWVFNVAPGVTFEKEEDVDTELLFAIHLEATYEWDFGNFHVGPVAEVAYDPEDVHMALGIHVGYGF